MPTTGSERPKVKYEALKEEIPLPPVCGVSVTGNDYQSMERESLELQREFRRGVVDYYQLRRHWSLFLMLAMGVFIAFQLFLVVAVGRGWLRFAGYEDFLKVQAAVYFVQVVGMCYIVVRCLFSLDGPAVPRSSVPQRRGNVVHTAPRSSEQASVQDIVMPSGQSDRRSN